MTALIALDWGTSSLRAARLGAGGQVLEERSSADGILQVPEGGFPAVFQRITQGWPLRGATCLASGMVGSRQGWREAPYCPCPADAGELAGHVLWLDDAPGGARLGIVPGLSAREAGVPDVMRGEEVQVFGALQRLDMDSGVFVLPGTHSKWVRVAAGRVTGFSTFMTGEVYAALRQHTILARTMAEGPDDDTAFLRGVQHALRAGSLLHGAFSARTLSLFGELTGAAGASYLSGLVIGEELRAQGLANSGLQPVLIGSPALTRRYSLALSVLGLQSRALGAEATWQGLWSLAQSLDTTA